MVDTQSSSVQLPKMRSTCDRVATHTHSCARALWQPKSSRARVVGRQQRR